MLILGNLNTLLIHTSLKTFFFLSHSETVTKAINTGTSTSGPITVVKATGEANPKVAIATASANSKLLPAAVKEIAVVLALLQIEI
jgi:hypothetical protein